MQFKLRTSIKGHVFANFLADFHAKRQNAKFELRDRKELWKLYVDGSSNKQAARAGVVLFVLGGLIIKQAIKSEFLASNNKPKYEALILELN